MEWLLINWLLRQHIYRLFYDLLKQFQLSFKGGWYWRGAILCYTFAFQSDELSLAFHEKATLILIPPPNFTHWLETFLFWIVNNFELSFTTSERDEAAILAFLVTVVATLPVVILHQSKLIWIYHRKRSKTTLWSHLIRRSHSQREICFLAKQQPFVIGMLVGQCVMHIWFRKILSNVSSSTSSFVNYGSLVDQELSFLGFSNHFELFGLCRRRLYQCLDWNSNEFSKCDQIITYHLIR